LVDEKEIKNCYVKMIDFSNIVELKEGSFNWQGLEVKGKIAVIDVPICQLEYFPPNMLE
jgi:hypothetical protein